MAVIFPENWQEWDDERIEVCLCHELSHIARGDLLSMLAGQLACTACWFNPLSWIAAAKLRDEAEHAADDAVLARNVRAETYAANLVAITEKYQASALSPTIALSMARPNRLKVRVEAILDSTLHRKSPGLMTMLTIGFLAVGALTTVMAVRLTAAPVVVTTSPATPSQNGAGNQGSTIGGSLNELMQTMQNDVDKATSSQSGLRVLQGYCGVDGSWRDITDVLQKLVRDNVLQVSWQQPYREVGGDPAPGKIKTLIIAYQLDGKTRIAAFPEENPPVGLRAKIEPAKAPQAHNASPDSTSWYLAGTRLSADAVADLEKEVDSKPDSPETRVKILGYYFPKGPLRESARAASQPHILWIIRNLPDSAAAGEPYIAVNKLIDPARYDEVRVAWSEQIAKQPNNAQVIGNAAAFFLLNDMPLAEKLLQQAQALEPKNPAWAQRLGQLYSLKAMRADASAKSPPMDKSGIEKLSKEVEALDPKDPTRAKRLEMLSRIKEMKGDAAMASSDHGKALQSYEAALPDKKAKGDKEGDLRFYQLATVAKAAFQAGDLTKARAYSEELLGTAPGFKGDWNYGNAVYTGNSVLGLVALSQDDVNTARTYLLAASETPGSPQLNSFGPDLTLAKKLLDRGEKEPVITFLGNVSKFWKGHEGKIKEWQETIRQGQTPQFAPLF